MQTVELILRIYLLKAHSQRSKILGRRKDQEGVEILEVLEVLEAMKVVEVKELEVK